MSLPPRAHICVGGNAHACVFHISHRGSTAASWPKSRPENLFLFLLFYSLKAKSQRMFVSGGCVEKPGDAEDAELRADVGCTWWLGLFRLWTVLSAGGCMTVLLAVCL